MKKSITFFMLAGLLSGCATTDWGKPIIPTVPPPKPSTEAKATTARPDGLKSKADTRKAEAVAPSETTPAETKSRAPVTAGQVTDRNARDIMKALEVELEQDAVNGPAKP